MNNIPESRYECDECGDIDEIYVTEALHDIDFLCGPCILGDRSICHLCGEYIDYCQGHGSEVCACICDEGCLCMDCGFDEIAVAIELAVSSGIAEKIQERI